MRGLFDQATLRGWKAIAEYLGISVSTAKRYEKLSLPVRRFLSGKPFALIFEIDKYFLIYEEMRRGRYKKKIFTKRQTKTAMEKGNGKGN